jgi:hypothetical protein
MDALLRGRGLWVRFDPFLSVQAIHRAIQAEIARRKEADLIEEPTGYRIFWFDRIERYDLGGNLLEVREVYDGVALGRDGPRPSSPSSILRLLVGAPLASSHSGARIVARTARNSGRAAAMLSLSAPHIKAEGEQAIGNDADGQR